MWYPATITAAASADPVTLAEAKAHCTVTGTAEDAAIGGLIAAARDHVEHYCAVRLSTQTVAVKCDGFADLGRLPEVPVQSVTTITYLDTAGDSQTLATEIYELRADGLEAAILLKYGQTWPAIRPGSRITLTAVVGFATAPAAIKAALLLLIGQLYALSGDKALIRAETVEGVGSRQMNSPEFFGNAITGAVERLLAPYRVFLR